MADGNMADEKTETATTEPADQQQQKPIEPAENSKQSPTLDEILARARTPRIKKIPYLGKTLYAHGFTATEADEFDAACTAAAGSVAKDAYSDDRMIAWCIRDADGTRIFADSDVTKIAAFNAADRRLFLFACYAVNGIGRIGEEYLAKN